MPTSPEIELLQFARKAGLESRAELANFMAQVTHESRDLTDLEEGFRYTRGIGQIPVRSALREGPEELEAARIQALNGRPETLAKLMYGGRMGNDNSGDGFRYRGRGYIQITGAKNYAAASEALGLDLAGNPDLAIETGNAARIAIWYWQTNVPQPARESVRAATLAINGGTNGLDDRIARYDQWHATLTPEFMADLDAVRVAQDFTPLSQGEQSSEIRTLQENLNALGLTDARGRVLKADGDYGKSTREAVESFQRQQGLQVDGVAGKATLAAMQTVTSVPNPVGEFRQFLKQHGIATPSSPNTGITNGLPDYLRANNPIHAPSRSSPSVDNARNLAPSRDALSDGVLRQGERGPAVAALQANLRHLGATNSKGRPLESDSIYGKDTKDGVERFQLWSGREITGVVDTATLDAIKIQAGLSIRQRAIDEAAGQPINDFADNVSLGVKIQPGDMADLAVPNPQAPAFASPSFPEPARPHEPREQRQPIQQPQAVPPQAAQPSTVKPIPDPSHDFRDSHHPQHVRYTQTLVAVHAMEDQRSIPHGANSERVAAALVDHMHKERFQELARVELRGDATEARIVAVQRQHTPWSAKKELVLDTNQAVARSVEQSSSAWAERALPHLQQPATPVETQTSSRTQSQFAEYDLRNPQHPEHSLYANVRGQVESAYATAGVPRTQEQLEQATAAVALSMRRDHMTHAEAVLLTPDPKTDVIGSNSTIITLQGEHSDPRRQRSVTTAQDLQRTPEDSYQQLTQQQAMEQTLAHQQRQERTQQQGNIAMG